MIQDPLDFEVPAPLRREFIFQTAGILPPHGILFGFHTVRKTGEQAKRLGASRVILITDETMVRLGYAGVVREAMEKEGLAVEVFGQVEAEPHMETADTLRAIVRGGKFDLVVGLGGGSPLDMAKLTSLAATNDLPPLEMMEKKVARNPALKKILIPTTSGTGSEVSMFFVASAGRRKTIMGTPYAFPEIAIVDPGLTLSLPPRTTAVTGIDALSHALESLMNRLANPFFDALGFAAAELVSRHLARATENGRDLEARYHMSMASTMAMISLSGTGGLYAHSISYVLAMFQPIDHGTGCGVSLPYLMAFNLPVMEDKMALIARSLGERIESLPPRAAGERALERVRRLVAGLKMPVSLKEMGFRLADIPSMAKICLSRYPRPNNPRPMSEEDCRILFEAMWEGDLKKISGKESES
ncbi:MAG: iron-containing alcohol dehydrogenase [Deltaproteobacteria bacterium]|nr:iron-containing alcohol dehydrogenase [Deltaproteobacteria bacterium]